MAPSASSGPATTNTPIGMVLAFALDDQARSLLRLTAHGAEVPRVRVIVDRNVEKERGKGT